MAKKVLVDFFLCSTGEPTVTFADGVRGPVRVYANPSMASIRRLWEFTTYYQISVQPWQTKLGWGFTFRRGL